MNNRSQFALQMVMAFVIGFLLVFGISSLVKEQRRARSRDGLRSDGDALSKDWYRVGQQLTQAGQRHSSRPAA
jgi:hypothetical protein